MTERMRLAMLDDAIEQVGLMSGEDQQLAAIALAVRELGCDLEGVESAAIHGRDLTLMIVRDAAGELRVARVAIAREGWA